MGTYSTTSLPGLPGLITLLADNFISPFLQI